MTQETKKVNKKYDQVKQTNEPCNCRKTMCQQMYCECLAKGRLCSKECRCEDCRNNKINEKLEKVIENIENQVYNKEQTSRVRFRSDRFNGGCTCKKSKCIKKYCECYQNNRKCDSGCKCLNCLNKNVQCQQKKKVKTSEFNYEQRVEFSLLDNLSYQMEIINKINSEFVQ